MLEWLGCPCVCHPVIKVSANILSLVSNQNRRGENLSLFFEQQLTILLNVFDDEMRHRNGHLFTLENVQPLQIEVVGKHILTPQKATIYVRITFPDWSREPFRIFPFLLKVLAYYPGKEAER